MKNPERRKTRFNSKMAQRLKKELVFYFGKNRWNTWLILGKNERKKCRKHELTGVNKKDGQQILLTCIVDTLECITSLTLSKVTIL